MKKLTSAIRLVGARQKRIVSKSERAGLALFSVLLLLFAGCRSVPEQTASGNGGNWADFQVHESEPKPPQKSPTFPEKAPALVVEETPGPVSYFDVPVRGQYIALTFDDGPSGWLTPRLLDTLRDHDIPATFFVLGRQAAAFPEIIQRMDEEGHEIANHTWDHPSLDRLSPAETREQLENTTRIIRALTKRTPTLMRPPYGRTNDTLNRWIADDLGMKVILWSVDSNDWRVRD
ncbi:MAG TPA: polysaccharide deacetylase family protein, partial [Opitutales bacterium]|nr:polysaccharide deacetylase family protein [Opitutales bacterium]